VGANDNGSGVAAALEAARALAALGREGGLAREASQDLEQFREAHDRRLRQSGRIMKLIVRIVSMNCVHA